MRKVTFGVACSLDGFIARVDGAVDWLLWSDEVWAITAAYWKRVDAVVMGRKTWEAGLRQGGGAVPGKENYILSRTLHDVPAGTVVVHDDPGAFVRALQARRGGEICVLGGGELAAALIAGGVVDEIGLNIHPVLLGEGIRLWHPLARNVQLELTECRELTHGCVYVLYRVIRNTC